MAVDYRQLILNMFIAANPKIPTTPTLEWVSVADQVTAIDPTDDNGHRNTQLVIFSNGGDDNPFENSVLCNYTRLDAKIDGGDITVDADKWVDDAFVLSIMNEKLKATYPDDEFTENDIHIERKASVVEEGYQSVFVHWNHLKFFPPATEEGWLEFVLKTAKADLSDTEGELDTFS